MSSKAGVHRGARASHRLTWSWHDDAQCWGEDLVLFFGPDGERQPERDIRERKAKAICAQCPVRAECLEYALSRPEQNGTWGGLNEDERANERRRRMRRQAETQKSNEPVPPDPARDLALFRQSEHMVAAGETVKSAARLLRVPYTSLRAARQRAQELLAGAS